MGLSKKQVKWFLSHVVIINIYHNMYIYSIIRSDNAVMKSKTVIRIKNQIWKM